MQISTRTFHASFLRLPTATNRPPDDNQSRQGSSAGQVLHERQKKRMQDMEAGIAKLQETKKSTSPKKLATQRAALLKQRLETLKSVMAKLPPGDYKMLAQELKQIAKELAALGKQLGDGSRSVVALPSLSFTAQNGASTTPDAEGMTTAASSAAAEPVASVESALAGLESTQGGPQPEIPEAAALSAQAEAGQMALAAGQNEKENPSSSGKLRLPGTQREDDDDDKALRSVLAEARKLLKETLTLLKIKHQNSDDKESRKLVADAERELEQLDKELSRGGMDLPDNIADMPAGTGAADTSPGGLVDIQA